MLHPTPIQSPVDQTLVALASQAKLIRGAIAYWTINPSFLGIEFARGLAHPEGYLCVDIHYPTSIDNLIQLRKTGANVCLHLYDLVGHTEDLGVKGVPPHLMHAKMLLFDIDETHASLWIGSHNATQRALFGINIEASMVVDLDKSTDNYRRAIGMLDAIRSRCGLMNPDLANYYKWLQSGADTENVIELEDQTGTSIPRSTITVFGTERSDHAQLGQVNKAVFVSITSSATGRERFYEARISQTGEMPRASKAAKGTSFDPRRYAFRRGTRLPELLPAGPIPPEVYREAYYYVTLDLKDALPEGVIAFEPPESPPWIYVSDIDLTARLRGRTFSGRRGDRPPRLRRAAPPENMRFEPLALDVRRSSTTHTLVRKRVFVRPGEDE